MSNTLLAGEDIVCFAFERWHGPWKTDQQIMSLLGRSNRVLYVAPPASLREAVTSLRNRVGRPPILERAGGDLYVYNEPRGLTRANVSRRTSRPFNWATETLRLAHIRWLARSLGFHSPILWIMDPMLAAIVGAFREKLVVYHVIDKYLLYFPPQDVVRRRAVVKNERAMLRVADCVFAVSQPILKRCLELNPNSLLVPNGVDYEYFQAAMTDEYVPEDVQSLPRPIIGYVGGIETRFKFDLWRQVARQRPEWSMMLVGHLKLGNDRSKLDALSVLPNVYYLGYKTPQEVPYYIKSCDVCVMIDDDEDTDVDSIKLYEYMACGRPVVSMDPAVERLKPLVEIATDATQFVAGVEQALRDGSRWREARMAFARESSWRRRVEVMSAAIRQRLAARAAPTDSSPSAFPQGVRS